MSFVEGDLAILATCAVFFLESIRSPLPLLKHPNLPDCVRVKWCDDLHRRQVKAQLPEVLRLEVPGLQLDHDAATKLQMVEEQGEEKLHSAHIDKTCRPAKAKPAPIFNRKSTEYLLGSININDIN